MNEIERFTTGVAASLEQQSIATGEISQNVASAATGTNWVVSALDQAAGAASQTRGHADLVREASDAVAAAAAKLEENVDRFLDRVAI